MKDRPNAKMKINKKGVRFESKVDLVQWTIKQLVMQALFDTGRLLKYKLVSKIRTLPGMSKGRRANKVVQTTTLWKEEELQIGFGDIRKGLEGGEWYGISQELGDKNQPKKGFLRATVFENIDVVKQIQAQYLSALNEQNPSDPGNQEYMSDGGNE